MLFKLFCTNEKWTGKGLSEQETMYIPLILSIARLTIDTAYWMFCLLT
jgi:hypothetical protein